MSHCRLPLGCLGKIWRELPGLCLYDSVGLRFPKEIGKQKTIVQAPLTCAPGKEFSSVGRGNENCCMRAASATLESLQKSLSPASGRLDLQSFEKSNGKGEGRTDL